MGTYTKPLPRVASVSKPFWEGTKRGELQIQRCDHCKKAIFYPRLYCPYCLSRELTWIKSSGKGTVETFSVIHSPPLESYKEDVPYVFGIIRLEEGANIASNIIGCDVKAVHIGMKVEVTFVPITEEFTLPKFKPIP